MYADPAIHIPETKLVIAPETKKIWVHALTHPEADLQRQAAESIARAHRLGLADLKDTAEPLMRLVELPSQHPLVRLAAVRALIEIGARKAAPLLFEHALSDGLDMAILVEPALTEWDYTPIRTIWLKRLAHSSEIDSRQLALAIEGLAAVGEEKAVPALRQLVVSRRHPPRTRFAAAQALGRLQRAGLEQLAQDLCSDQTVAGMVDRLLAANLLRHHSGKAAHRLIRDLALDEEPSVSALALEALLEVDAKAILAFVDQIISSPDAKVRLLGAQALAALPSPQSITLLGPLLDDRHPDVRRYVRQSLQRHAEQAEFESGVRQQAMAMLATDRWRGLEQSLLLLGSLDHKPCADRALELLDHDRAEVFVTAAWVLRKLAVPETLPAMLACAERQGKKNLENARVDRFSVHIDRQIAQLFQAFGQMGYQPAEAVMRTYVPKDTIRLASRTAAVWALGHLHAGDPNAELTKLFVERLTDIHSLMPEHDPVRRMAAVSLGRMTAVDGLPELRDVYRNETSNSYVGYASGWAVQQLTGEPVKPPKRRTGMRLGWFLEPLDIAR